MCLPAKLWPCMDPVVIPALFDKSSKDIKGLTLEKVISVKCKMKEKRKNVSFPTVPATFIIS